ncbi:MAG: nuclear transport factor 2 family protein [Chloroflexi bacterium]|nr:nuclear transport factor 2 family protein [Chloroflexota bacterium]MDA1004093.1 nuclear transport factor 2 family protein [Chloroflexota bacterium]
MSTDEDDVLAANRAFYEAFNAKDLPAMDALWARSASVACVHPGWNVLAGREPVMASWTAILGNAAQPRVQSGAESVYLFGDLAYVICRELVSGSPLAATNVFVREDAAWRIVHHHSSPVAVS